MNARDFERDERDPRPLPGPNTPRQKSPYQFTPDELRVLKDCNRESFFQRCLPLSALLGGGMYYGVKTGALKGHPRFGATPKVIVAAVVGYFVGKFSYQGKCAEKLMMLPNSPIGEMLRQKRRGGFQESMEPGFGPGMSLAPFSGVNPSETYSDLPPKNNLDMDTTRPELDGLDDSQRPSIDNPIYEDEMPPVQKQTTTYDELRKQNREEYQQRRTGNYRCAPDSTLVGTPGATPKQQPEMPKGPTNKYGDSWG